MISELFDRLVEPVVLYASEVWGFHDAPHIERLHTKFCKWVLCVKTSTPNIIARHELGRVDLKTKRFVKIIKYWVKIIKCENTRYIKHMYDVLLKDEESNKSNWASQVKKLLYSAGMGEAWFFQTVGNEHLFISTFKQRLYDIHKQTDISELSKNTRGKYYLNINPNLDPPQYLNKVKVKKHRIYFTKLRTSSHILRIETGRWKKPVKEPLNERKCTVCNALDDEYHFMLECKLHNELRAQYIPALYRKKPSMYKFVNILQTDDVSLLKKVCVYVYKAMKTRLENV